MTHSNSIKSKPDTLRGSLIRKGFDLFLLCGCLALYSRCDEETEPEPEKQTYTYTLHISSSFFNPNTDYIVSDFSGKILKMEKFANPGLNTLEVEAPVDEQLHLTIFNGSFMTFAFAPPTHYTIEPFFVPQSPGTIQTHRINLINIPVSQITAGGTNIFSSFRANENQLDLLLTGEQSDALINIAEFGAHGHYIYLPQVRPNESTDITFNDFVSAPELEPLAISFPQGFLILEASTNPSDSIFNFDLALQSLNPFDPNLYLPPAAVTDRFERYHMNFFGFNNTTYEAYVDFIPTETKMPMFSREQTVFRDQALSYTINGEANAVSFFGFVGSAGWTVHGPLGTNVKINLPHFDKAFQRSRNIAGLDQIIFSSATVIKDTRATFYYDYLAKQLDQGSLAQPSNFEIIKSSFVF